MLIIKMMNNWREKLKVESWSQLSPEKHILEILKPYRDESTTGIRGNVDTNSNFYQIDYSDIPVNVIEELMPLLPDITIAVNYDLDLQEMLNIAKQKNGVFEGMLNVDKHKDGSIDQLYLSLSTIKLTPMNRVEMLEFNDGYSPDEVFRYKRGYGFWWD